MAQDHGSPSSHIESLIDAAAGSGAGTTNHRTPKLLPTFGCRSVEPQQKSSRLHVHLEPWPPHGTLATRACGCACSTLARSPETWEIQAALGLGKVYATAPTLNQP